MRQMAEPLDHVVLIGEMGTGKTTLGVPLADALNRPFLDSDEVMDEATGSTGAEIASRIGVEELHERELEAFVAMTGVKVASVLAPASSVVDTEEGRDLLRRCVTVWLVAPDAVLAVRQRQGDHRRPVTAEERMALRRRRNRHLEEICDAKLDTSSAGPTELVGVLLDLLRETGVVGPNQEADGHGRP